MFLFEVTYPHFMLCIIMHAYAVRKCKGMNVANTGFPI